MQGIALLGAGRRYDLSAVHMGMVFLIGPGYNGFPDTHTVSIIGICHGDIIEPTVYILATMNSPTVPEIILLYPSLRGHQEVAFQIKYNTL